MDCRGPEFADLATDPAPGWRDHSEELRMRCVLLSAIVVVSLSTAPVLAQGRGQEGGKPPTPAATEPSSHRVSDREVAVIREYFRDHGIKPKPLPPGIAKNLARGKPLPSRDHPDADARRPAHPIVDSSRSPVGCGRQRGGPRRSGRVGGRHSARGILTFHRKQVVASCPYRPIGIRSW